MTTRSGSPQIQHYNVNNIYNSIDTAHIREVISKHAIDSWEEELPEGGFIFIILL